VGDLRVKQIDRVLEFMQRTPDELVTIRRVAQSLGIDNADSLSGALNRLCTKYPNMERVQRGVYRWTADPVTEESSDGKDPEDFLMQFISRRDDKILVRDTMTNELWVMTRFEF
jgi:predicted transcriptional regulator of viral defense system